jgi:hypothetical protein
MRVFYLPPINGVSYTVRADKGWAELTMHYGADSIMQKLEGADLPRLMTFVAYLLEAYYVAIGENPPEIAIREPGRAN